MSKGIVEKHETETINVVEALSSRLLKEQKTDGGLGPELEIRRATVAEGERDVAVEGIGKKNREFIDQKV